MNSCPAINSALAVALLLITVVLPMECVAEPGVPDAASAEAGVSLMRFDYKEYMDGHVPDAEKGVIPGVSFKVGQRLSEWEWEGMASFQHGRADYIGQLQNGVPYNTRTDETIGDVALRINRHFDWTHSWALYGGLGYRRWDREILPGASGGLFESYRWPYLWAGTKFTFFQEGRSRVMLDIGILRPISPEVRVDFEGAYSVSPTVYPVSRRGLRMMLPSTIALSGNAFLNLEAYLDFWNLESSPAVAGFYEPASRTRNMGLNIRVGRTF